jgi:hypothetical protein
MAAQGTSQLAAPRSGIATNSIATQPLGTRNFTRFIKHLLHIYSKSSAVRKEKLLSIQL